MRRLDDLLRLDGRVALITGGAGYLGLAYGEALSELGANVVVVDRDQAACDARACDLAQHGGRQAMGIAADLARDDAAEVAVSRALDRFGRLDVLINNAAFTGMSGLKGYAVPFEDQLLEAWDLAYRVNLTAVFLFCKAAHKALAASTKGSIINISSIYGMVGPDFRLYEGTTMGNPAVYAATKGGIIQLTRYLATAFAPSIRVNCVTPGGIERGQPAAFHERYNAKTPLGRMGREEDFKGPIALLAGDASAYMTGQNIVVDGGWTVW